MIKKILVPLDGSEFAEQALSYAEEMAYRFEASLLLVRVLHPLVVMSDYSYQSYDDLIDAERKEATVYLGTLQQKFQARSLKVETCVADSLPPAEKIIDLAEQEDIDLIVMTTHGRTGFRRWIFGSVANKVLQHAPCPIYLVRAKEADK